MPFSEAVSNEVMVKCGRRCCICRRFRPIHLQIHHIIEQSDGGTDDIENAIPICLPCHTDVHSTVPFARKFTTEELRRQRDDVYKMVSDGRLVESNDHSSGHSQGFLEALRAISTRSQQFDVFQLPRAAVQLLVTSAFEDGMIKFFRSMSGSFIEAGRTTLFEGSEPRKLAEYEDAIDALLRKGFIKRRGIKGEIFAVTHTGYLIADELAAVATKEKE